MRRLSLETILDIQVFLKFVVNKEFNKNCFKTNFVVFLSTRSLKIVNRYNMHDSILLDIWRLLLAAFSATVGKYLVI